MIEESAHDFGGGLFGVLTRPAERARRVAVVLLNAGFIHRVGPFRLHVDVARELAALGFAVLRVDEPGIGDAPPKRGPDDVAAVRRAFDRLGELAGADRFVVGGLCSAADRAWKVALADARVVGALLLDGYVRRGGYWYRLGQMQLLFGRGVGAFATLWRQFSRPRDAADDAALRDWPTPEQARSGLARLVERGVRVFALYTGGAATYFTHPRQFEATYGAAAHAAGVRFEHWREADHLFLQQRDRARLIDAIRAWCDEEFR
ncbi:MAG TPA: alpha/beta hydrolase [Dokdonella sp.]